MILTYNNERIDEVKRIKSEVDNAKLNNLRSCHTYIDFDKNVNMLEELGYNVERNGVDEYDISW